LYRTKGPKLKDLQDFTKGYFNGKECPVVIFKEFKKTKGHGWSDIDNKKIYLNRNMSLKRGFGADIGDDFYPPEDNINLKSAEQYFAVLLHEIKHFKVAEKFQLPKEWNKLRKRFNEEYCFAKKITNKKELMDFAFFFAINESCFSKRRGEKEIKRQERIEDFVYWVVHGYPLNHIKVVDWSLKEFKKRREDISRYLN